MKCGDVLSRQFEGMDGKGYYLLSDEELRNHYGQLIGEIASSHHWETERITSLPTQVNGLTSLSTDWTICPRKLACIFKKGEDTVVSVTDNGVGMSLSTISHSLLNFGSSFWHGDDVHDEFPGLKTAGFKSVGQFGIGFFSVFMFLTLRRLKDDV